MNDDLQIATNIINKQFGKRRYKIIVSIDKLKNKCIMLEISECHLPSNCLYYNNKNEDNVEELLETCHFGNQFSFPHNNDITRIDLTSFLLVKTN